jgi:hypothetical protein
MRRSRQAMHSFRVVTWNVSSPSAESLATKLERLVELRADVVLLQEIRETRAEQLRQSDLFDDAITSFEVPDRRKGWPCARHDLGCAVGWTRRFVREGAPERLPSVPGTLFPAPERTLAVSLRDRRSGLSFVAGSLYQVPGRRTATNKWGPEAKRNTNTTWAPWLGSRTAATIIGLDTNSPEIDHPDEALMKFYSDPLIGSQREEWILGLNARHRLRDALREHLRSHPRLRREITDARPLGPLAYSHWNTRTGKLRRYDYILVSPDLAVIGVEYREELLTPGGHAPVVVSTRASRPS